MINKCRGRIVQGDYIMRNIFNKKGRRKIEKKKKKGEQSALHWDFVLQTYINICLLGRRNLIH